MRWDVLRAGIDLLPLESAFRTDVTFSGGEPLLEFELLRRAVEYGRELDARRERLRYLLITNGLLLTPEVADFLEQNEISVNLSFDGVARAQNCRGAGSFEVLDRVLDSLRAGHPSLFGKRLRVAITVIPSTVRYLAASVRYLIDKGVREISLGPALLPPADCDQAVEAELACQLSEVAAYCARNLQETGHLPVTSFRRSAGEASATRRQWSAPCAALTGTMLTLDTNGEVYTCPMFAQSYQEFPRDSLISRLSVVHLGHLTDPELLARRDVLREAVRNGGIQDYRAELQSSYGRCSDCEYLGRCTVCPVSVWYAAGEAGPFRVPDFICAFTRILFRTRDQYFPPPQTSRPADTRAPDAYDPIEPLERYLRSIRSERQDG